MTIILLFAISLQSSPAWYQSPHQPDSTEFRHFMDESPLFCLVFMARTGFRPEWISLDQLIPAAISTDPGSERTVYWSAQLIGEPVQSQMIPSLIEFGDPLLNGLDRRHPLHGLGRRCGRRLGLLTRTDPDRDQADCDHHSQPQHPPRRTRPPLADC